MTAFFVVTLGTTWTLLTPYVLAKRGILPAVFQFPALAAKFGPSLAGLLMTSWVFGERGLRDLWQRCLRWRVGLSWWIGCLLGPFVLLFAANVLAHPDAEWSLGSIFVFVPRMLRHVFLGGGLGEELGWRGFALPLLQQRIGALGASVVIGAVWALWHLPQSFIDPSRERWLEFVPFSIAVVLGSIVFAWVYNGTGGSVLLCVILHASVNAWSATLNRMTAVEPGTADPTGVWILCGLLAPLALYPIVRYGPRTLARARA